MFCEAAGGLGLDPYGINDEAAAFIENAEGLFEGEPLVDFVTGAANVTNLGFSTGSSACSTTGVLNTAFRNWRTWFKIR